MPPVLSDTWSEWKLALLKCGRIENFMEELNNKQNAELDELRNFQCVDTEVDLNHTVIVCFLLLFNLEWGGGPTLVSTTHASIP